MARSVPSSPSQSLAAARIVAVLMAPLGLWTMAPLGAPASRMRRVRRRVSTPAIPTMSMDFSQVSRCWAARQFDGSVMSARRIQPRAAGVVVSTSSAFAPTLPIWGNVKVMI